MKRKEPIRDKEEGYIYVACWYDGRLGWSLSPHMTPTYRSDKQARRYVSRINAVDRPWAKHQPHYLCRVKIEVVRDSLGRPIVHYPGGKKD